MYSEVIKFTSVFINVSFAFYTVNEFFNLFFRKKSSRILRAYIPMSMYLLWQALVSVHVFHPTIVLGISIILIWLHMLTRYNNGNTVVKLGLVTLYISIWIMSEIIIGFVFIYFNVDIVEQQVLGSFASKCLTLFLIFLIRYFHDNDLIDVYERRYAYWLLIVPNAGLVVMCVLFEYVILVSLENVEMLVFGMLGLLLIAFNIIVFRIYQLLSIKYKIKQENIIVNHQVLIQKEHYMFINNMLNEIRTIKHDNKHRATVLIELLEKNDVYKAKMFLMQEIECPETMEGYKSCGNDIIDASIKFKYSKIINSRINFEYRIDVPVIMFFPEVDISIILGNILDNAIEANLSNENLERMIRLKIAYEGDSLLIVCENSYDGKVVRDRAGQIKTTKKGLDRHGYGINSVKQVCKKYNGTFSFEEKENIITVRVLLFIARK